MKMKKEAEKRLKIFLEFIIFGVVLGFIENIIAIISATDHLINLRAIIISILVVIPFAAIGELIVDKTNFIPKTKNKSLKHLEVFFEFLIFGVIMGVVEDIIVISTLTGEPITLQIVWIVTIVTAPFAVVGEVIIDRYDWLSWIKKKTNFIRNGLLI